MHVHLKIAIASAALAMGTVVGAQELPTGELQTYGPLKQPRPVRGAKPLPNPGLDALRGDGIEIVQCPLVDALQDVALPAEVTPHK